MRGVGAFNEFIERISELEKERAELRRVLSFYADYRRYDGPNLSILEDDPFQPEALSYRYDVTRDGGALARSALRGSRPKGPDTMTKVEAAE